MDHRVTDFPTYPGSNLQDNYAWDGSCYCIQPNQDIDGDPLLPNRQKFLMSRNNYQFICYTESFGKAWLIRIKVDGNLYSSWDKIEHEYVSYLSKGYMPSWIIERIDKLKKTVIRNMENKYLTFDGKTLTFQIDGITVNNGKYPDGLPITDNYIISADSLTKLLVAMNEGSLGTIDAREFEISGNKYVSRIYYQDGNKNECLESIRTTIKEEIENKDQYIETLKEEIRIWKQYKEENIQLKRLLEAHNQLSWIKRISPINYKRECE